MRPVTRNRRKETLPSWKCLLINPLAGIRRRCGAAPARAIARPLCRALEKMTDTIGLSRVDIYDRIAGENRNFIFKIHNEGVKTVRKSRKRGKEGRSEDCIRVGRGSEFLSIGPRLEATARRRQSSLPP